MIPTGDFHCAGEVSHQLAAVLMVYGKTNFVVPSAKSVETDC